MCEPAGFTGEPWENTGAGLKKYKQQHDVDYKNERHENYEIPVLGLVPEKIHPEQRAQASADDACQKQAFFRDSPDMFLCLVLVDSHEEKAD